MTADDSSYVIAERNDAAAGLALGGDGGPLAATTSLAKLKEVAVESR